ncbi:protocadherin gamma-C5-like [Protopterus annectens]|uniref:protocadherin gamma-C5-like n=1 Tax=Protopterus annectens TaxID=7888 RepID=UPI001CFBB0F8|nr:protocadherin gamma-C5-like [Protopterus annectens]
MECKGLGQLIANYAVALYFTLCILDRISGQIHYIISEELNRGSVVGNVAKDLGLQLQSISGRNPRIVSKSKKDHFSINSKDGILIVADKTDREELCTHRSSCFLHLQLILENPLEVHSVKVEILDINDNPPRFPAEHFAMEIMEGATMVGARYELEGAQDPDIGVNSLSNYWLTPSEYFVLRVKTSDDGIKVPEIVLQKALDREQQSVHHLILTAVDGGNPALSGTVNITVIVFDFNDNAPKFNQSSYNVRLKENSPIGTVVIQLKATDPDEGVNGEIEYSFRRGRISGNVNQVFSIDPHTGEIRTSDVLDFEDVGQYTIQVKAKDRGTPTAEEYCTVNVEIIDVNDNAPEVILNSLANSIKEDALPGTVVALISVSDNDYGENGRVHLQIPPDIPFKLVPSLEDHYTLITQDFLDREANPQYNITVKATDLGSPPLSAQRMISINISDVNDNSPRFSQSSYTTHVQENNHPGLFLCSVIASDPDDGKNSKLSYSIRNQKIGELPVSSYFYINPENGSLYSARSFNYEEVHYFQLQIQAEDMGSPPLRTNVTVDIFIIDQNDNAPQIVYPKAVQGSTIQQTIPRSAQVGYLVTKIVGIDEDRGYNAWLSYKLQPSQDVDEFLIAPYTGEIRTAKVLQDSGESTKNVVVEVKDSGKPALSTSVTLLLFLEDNSEGFSGYKDIPVVSSSSSNLTLYLIISLIVSSFVLFLTFAALAVNCLRKRKGDTLCSADLCCCYTEQNLDTKYPYDYCAGSLRVQLNSDGPLKYVEVRPSGMISQPGQSRSCLPPVVDGEEFLFLKPTTNADTFSSSTSNPTDSANMEKIELPEEAYVSACPNHVYGRSSFVKVLQGKCDKTGNRTGLRKDSII